MEKYTFQTMCNLFTAYERMARALTTTFKWEKVNGKGNDDNGDLRRCLHGALLLAKDGDREKLRLLEAEGYRQRKKQRWRRPPRKDREGVRAGNAKGKQIPPHRLLLPLLPTIE